MKQLILITFSLVYVGCAGKHKATIKVCGDQFYIESFNVNPAGVDEDYLTDSLSFRVYIGKYDNDHQNFSYVCKGNSITIMKLEMENQGNQMKITNSKILSFADLKNKKNIKEPLFEFE
jgi:hypothetical protein